MYLFRNDAYGHIRDVQGVEVKCKETIILNSVSICVYEHITWTPVSELGRGPFQRRVLKLKTINIMINLLCQPHKVVKIKSQD